MEINKFDETNSYRAVPKFKYVEARWFRDYSQACSFLGRNGGGTLESYQLLYLNSQEVKPKRQRY